METGAAGRRGGLTRWAKVRSKKARSAIMSKVRRGIKGGPEYTLADLLAGYSVDEPGEEYWRGSGRVGGEEW